MSITALARADFEKGPLTFLEFHFLSCYISLQLEQWIDVGNDQANWLGKVSKTPGTETFRGGGVPPFPLTFSVRFSGTDRPWRGGYPPFR